VGDTITADNFYSAPGVKALFKELWNKAPVDTEVAAWLLRITQPPSYRLTGFKQGGASHVNIGKAPPGVVAQLHTHPTKLDPRPSTRDSDGGKGDWGAAVKLGLPVYVISIWAIWKVMPNEKDATIVQVAKDWL
jgi:hypothetical protein